MLTMNELVDLRMQQQIAHEIYRQQIMQRLPDPFPAMLPIPMPHHVIMPPRPTLPGAEAKLENGDLWKQFHKIGTEMIITKSGRRMFPSMRVSVSGLEEESTYCILLEMVPIGDCRYKFSGSHWVPAGGAEPQSPQRMFLHPDSPATGAHWQSQAILFNKVKLTNNTLDSNGHIVLASMHKYQPRLHVIRTSDLSQLPWAPQQAFVFPETEFVAVTAYQNDRITKLKIDNNPFAKGFRETGQSRCKRKLLSLSEDQSDNQQHQHQPTDNPRKVSCSTSSTASMSGGSTTTEDDRSSVSSFDSPHAKRLRSAGSIDEEIFFHHSPQRYDVEVGSGGGGVVNNTSTSSNTNNAYQSHHHVHHLAPHPSTRHCLLYNHHHHHHHALGMPSMDAARAAAAAAAYFATPAHMLPGFFAVESPHASGTAAGIMHLPHDQQEQQQQQEQLLDSTHQTTSPPYAGVRPATSDDGDDRRAPLSPSASSSSSSLSPAPTTGPAESQPATAAQAKRNNFSISAILAF